MDDQLEERVATLERAVTDGEGDAAALTEAAVTAERLESLEATVEDLEDRVAELAAGTQALRGYVGNVRSVNREVEERADLALSRVEALSGQPAADDDASTQDRSGGDCEPNPEGGPGHEGEQRPSSGRCDRCGRASESRARTERSERRTPDSVGEQDRHNSTHAGERTADTVGALDGGKRWPGERTSPGEPSWSDSSVPGPTRDGVDASDSPDTDGPIDRLRQLL